MPAAKRVKRAWTEEAPRRQSARLRKLDEPVDPNETPAQRRKRLAEAEERQKKEEEERILAEEQAHLAKRPRAEDLDLAVLASAEELSDQEMSALRASLQAITHKSIPRGIGNVDAWVYESDQRDEREAQELRKRLGKMKAISRAKVTQDRVYSAAYHPEPTKDLIFFGGKRLSLDWVSFVTLSQTSMGNLASGMHEPPLTKLLTKTAMLGLSTASLEVNIGVFSSIGQPPPNPLFRPSG